MLDRLGRFTVRRHRRILLATLVAFAVAGAVGGGVADHLSSGGFENPKAESIKAKRVVEDQFRAGAPNLVLLVTARTSNVDDPSVAAGAAALTQELANAPGIQQSCPTGRSGPRHHCGATTESRPWCWPESAVTRTPSTLGSRSCRRPSPARTTPSPFG